MAQSGKYETESEEEKYIYEKTEVAWNVWREAYLTCTVSCLYEEELSVYVGVMLSNSSRENRLTTNSKITL